MSAYQVITLSVAGVGATVGLLTGIRALIEYRQQGTQKRATQFLELRHRFTANECFTYIADLVDLATKEDTCDAAEAELASLPLKDKRRYVGFFEDVALALYSGLVSVEIADYMFGYYARACWDSRAFWSGEMGSKAHPYWMLFAVFCRDMKAQQQSFESGCADDHYVREAFRFSHHRIN